MSGMDWDAVFDTLKVLDALEAAQDKDFKKITRRDKFQALRAWKTAKRQTEIEGKLDPMGGGRLFYKVAAYRAYLEFQRLKANDDGVTIRMPAIYLTLTPAAILKGKELTARESGLFGGVVEDPKE